MVLEEGGGGASCRPEVFSFKSFHERWNPLPQSHHTCPAAAPLAPLKFCIISKSPLPQTTSPLRISLIRSTSTHTAVQPPRGWNASGTLCHRTLDCPSHQTHLFKHSVFNLIIQLYTLRRIGQLLSSRGPESPFIRLFWGGGSKVP